jgi:hypothetical protein
MRTAARCGVPIRIRQRELLQREYGTFRFDQQNSNAYGRWGSSTVSGPNQTVHTQSQSNAQGSAGSFTSSSGAKGAAVSGAGGNTAGAVKTSGGDVYAGADGNVYKKTDSGWQNDNGSWNSCRSRPRRKPRRRGNAAQRGQRVTVTRRSGTCNNRGRTLRARK